MKLYFYKLNSDGMRFEEYEAEARETPKMYIGEFPNYRSRIYKDEINQVLDGISNKWYITDYPARVEALNAFYLHHKKRWRKHIDYAADNLEAMSRIDKLLQEE